MIYIPIADARTLHNAIPGAKEKGNGIFHVPCSANAKITFFFQGIGYSIRSEDYVGTFVGSRTVPLCESEIMGYSSQPWLHGEWIAGCSFLINASIYYTV
jgi:hypothetical protein